MSTVPRVMLDTHIAGFVIKGAHEPLRATPLASAYGELCAELENQSVAIGNLDTLIAAHALAAGCALATNDKAFGRVPGLTVEDGLAA